MTRVSFGPRVLAAIGILSITLGLGLQGDAAAQAGTAAKVARKTPPLVLPEYQLPRPNDVVRKTYQFAADHPEVLKYVPCYCGCDQMGHMSNAECFVKARAKNGDVTEWQEHGMVCAMCLAVCEQSMHMYEAGASLKQIHDEADRKFSGMTAFRTPTPDPPAR